MTDHPLRKPTMQTHRDRCQLEAARAADIWLSGDHKAIDRWIGASILKCCAVFVELGKLNYKEAARFMAYMHEARLYWRKHNGH